MSQHIEIGFDKKSEPIEYGGWINIGPMAGAGSRWRVQVWTDEYHDWCLVELETQYQGRSGEIDTFILPLCPLRHPGMKMMDRDAGAVFSKALARKLEQPVSERLLAWRDPENVPRPCQEDDLMTPLRERTARLYLQSTRTLIRWGMDGLELMASGIGKLHPSRVCGPLWVLYDLERDVLYELALRSVVEPGRRQELRDAYAEDYWLEVCPICKQPFSGCDWSSNDTYGHDSKLNCVPALMVEGTVPVCPSCAGTSAVRKLWKEA